MNEINENITKMERLEFSEDIINKLDETSKWSKFLAILGFIFIGLLVILGFVFGAIFSRFSQGSPFPFPSFLFGFIYILISLIYFFPCLFLLKFAIHTRKGLNESKISILSDAFGNLRSFFRFIGILSIIVLGIYVILLIVFLIIGSITGF